MKYRKLKNYKYKLMENYTLKLNINLEKDLIFNFIEFLTTGQLLIKQNYAWDGATGLPLTPTEMLRGSLVHDVLYQLMRLGALDYKIHRILADKIFKQFCIEDGTPKITTECMYRALRLLGEQFAKPVPVKEIVILEAP